MFNDYIHINGNKVHSTALVDWDNIQIGTGNEIGPFVCIGGDPEHKSLSANGIIKIGNNNIFKEYVCVHRATKNNTVIGNNNYLMSKAHIAHDCILEDDITMCNNVVLAGHVTIMKGATLGLGCTVHQFQVIGSYTMLGMNCTVTKNSNILPGNIYIETGRLIGKNTIGLERNNITDINLKTETQRYKNLRDSI